MKLTIPVNGQTKVIPFAIEYTDAEKRRQLITLDNAIEFELNVSLKIEKRNRYRDLGSQLYKDENSMPSERHKMFREAVKVGLKAIHGVTEEDMANLQWDGDEVPDKVLDQLAEVRIPFYDNLIDWLGMEIISANTPSMDQLKNFVLQSTQ